MCHGWLGISTIFGLASDCYWPSSGILWAVKLYWIQLQQIMFHSLKTMLFTRGQFWPPGIVVACVCVYVYQPLACPHDNSSPVQAGITKFGSEKQNTLVKIPIVLMGN